MRRADLCAIAVDAAAGATKQDRRIARMVLEARKPCIIIANKFDLYHPGAPLKDRLAVLREELEEGLFFVPYAPVVATSAKEGAFINKIFGAIERVRKAAAEPVTTGALNRMLQMALNRNPPPARGGKRFKLLYATAAKTDENDPRVVPVPRFVLFCNDASLITEPYLRYIENQIRAEHPFVGLPIRFDLRDRAPKAKP
ncbi:MAG: GTP-binding protein [Verrucomicrobiales bacterium]